MQFEQFNAQRSIAFTHGAMAGITHLLNWIGDHKSSVCRTIGMRRVAVDAMTSSCIDFLPALKKLMIVSIVGTIAARLNGVLNLAWWIAASTRQYFGVTFQT